jgi:molybdopterin converting factor subunit 1
MANIHIEYFAVLREHAGVERETVETEAATPADVYAELTERYSFPEFQTVKVAVNDEFASWDAGLQDGDTLVFIPPVAGG